MLEKIDILEVFQFLITLGGILWTLTKLSARIGNIEGQNKLKMTHLMSNVERHEDAIKELQQVRAKLDTYLEISEIRATERNEFIRFEYKQFLERLGRLEKFQMMPWSGDTYHNAQTKPDTTDTLIDAK